ncbi:Subtilase family protein [Evansella caseinilytica]|uniref:Subtilase family protein n=1 Tax=Evansella caseinilytica TaxID=1503961 RepID=A0A1H3NLM0_9BACI|nr:S8 family peptidase [Evansella caseinilytica]SDY89698.1 Subtilase family protein [Evansella caseinilytica]
MNSIFRLALFFSTILLFIIGVWFVSDHSSEPFGGNETAETDASFRAAMNATMAEDFSYTIQLFLHQIEEDLLRWEKADGEEKNSFKKKLIREVEQHSHINGFSKYVNEEETLRIGEIRADAEALLTRTNSQGMLLSEPFVARGMKRMIIGKEKADGLYLAEVDLSFIESFVKEMAAVSDTNGDFFIGEGGMDVSVSDEEAEAPYVKQEIPDIGWNIYIQDKEGEAEEEEQHMKEGEVIVELASDVDARQWAQSQQLTIVAELNSKVIVRDLRRTTDDIMNDLKTDASVQLMEPNYLYTKQTSSRGGSKGKGKTNDLHKSAVSVPNDEFYEPYQWNLSQIYTEEGWSFSVGDEEVPIAIVDSGVDPEHIDLAARIKAGFNAFEDNQAYNDENGHGTHVAGIAAAITNNEAGVAGVSWNNPLLAVKVLDQNAEGNALSIAKGIIWAVDQGARVINLSLGDSHDSDLMYDAVRYAYERDVVLIAASGNDDVETPMFPAAYDEVLAVAAVDPQRERAFFSNYGEHIDVSAPGEHIPSTFPENQYVVMSGTSMAAPHVTGLAGLIRSINPSLTNEDVYDLIRETSDDLGDKGFDPFFGYGEINIRTALEALMQQ